MNMALRIALGVTLAIVGLAFLRFKPWRRTTEDSSRARLEVGFLPVT